MFNKYRSLRKGSGDFFIPIAIGLVGATLLYLVHKDDVKHDALVHQVEVIADEKGNKNAIFDLEEKIDVYKSLGKIHKIDSTLKNLSNDDLEAYIVNNYQKIK